MRNYPRFVLARVGRNFLTEIAFLVVDISDFDFEFPSIKIVSFRIAIGISVEVVGRDKAFRLHELLPFSVGRFFNKDFYELD